MKFIKAALLLNSLTAISALSLEAILQTFERSSLKDRLEIFKLRTSEKINGNVGNKQGDFSVLQSPLDEKYMMRIKPVDPLLLNVDTVKQWSGYLDYDDTKHFFYWFFESRNDPENDPVVLWLNGGPGCSSFTGLFFELGPSSIGQDLKPIYNPYSWNSNASVIFLDQPIGVGFSYGDEKIATTDSAAKDVYVFLDLFFQKFPHLRKNAFHISGESYAGHYIPRIAHEIAVVHEEDASFNLTSVLIGNGFTDPFIQYKYYEPMACGEGGYPSVLEPKDCRNMQRRLPVCLSLVNACYKSKSTFSCVLADRYCEEEITGVYSKTELNPYDIRGKCEASEQSGNCYIEEEYISSYLNQKFVQEALGSDIDNFISCNSDVGVSFSFTGDGPQPFQQYVAELLNAEIPVLIYAGDKDYICNWLGNLAWTNALDWRHSSGYTHAAMKKWYNKETEELAGETKSFGGFTFLRIYNAGHMVPHDQPENSLDMLKRWIGGDYEFNNK